jgi:HlyD family secretion protein
MTMNKKLTIGVLLSLAIVLALTGCGKKSKGGGGGGGDSTGGAAAGPTAAPVDVTSVVLGNIKKRVAVEGNLATLYTVQLSPRTAGRLIAVSAREGDFVRKGEVLAQIDPTIANAEVQQDQADLLSDESKVEQAQVQYTQSITNGNVAVQQAQATLDSANVVLQKTIVGDQPQQKLQAQDDLIQQKANYANALSNYQEQAELFKEGAIAQSDLNNAITTYQTQKALLDNYQQALSLALEGGRPEDVAAQKEVVAEDREALKNAVANLANVSVDKDAIASAQAVVDQAKAQVASAEQDVADTNLVSPIDGYVAQRSADPGSLASPGTSVMEIVDLSTVYYEPTVSEQDLAGLHAGDPVTIHIDAFPSTAFHGSVAAVFPSSSATDRQFSLRVDIPNANGQLRPGMYARGSITTATARGVIVVPLSALVPRSLGNGFSSEETSTGIATGTTVLPPEMVFIKGAGNTATSVNVEVGIVSSTKAQIVSGLNVGDMLIVKGQALLNPGDKIEPTVVTAQQAMAGTNDAESDDDAGP